MKKMLVMVAHPSDESFVFGGTIAKYAKTGWNIVLVCATSGERSNSGLYDWAKGDALPALRQEEVKKASDLLGVREIRFLGLKDGGLSSETPGTLEDPIERTMLDFLPDIILTFPTNGINNDPDHVKMSYAVTYAFQKYTSHLEQVKNPENVNRGRGKLWKREEYLRAFGDVEGAIEAPKLYYACYPKHEVSYLQKEKRLPLESFSKPLVGTLDKHITTVIDISREKRTKKKALLYYETQRETVEPFLSFDSNPFLNHEYYLLRMHGIFEVFMGKTDRVRDRLS